MNLSGYRQVMHRIRSGTAAEVSLDFCELVLLRERRQLTFGERKLIELVRARLVSLLQLEPSLTIEDLANRVCAGCSKDRGS